MSRTWLCLDMHFLAWRAYHTTGSLRHIGVATGVLYGVFRDLVTFSELHDTPHMMFAFDKKPYKRNEILASYKDNRKKDPELDQFFDEVRKQIALLRNKYLKELGYRNIFWEPGYEADDVIASFIKCLPSNDKAIIIASDKDLLQLLDDRTIVWNPNSKKPTTVESFIREQGVTPEQWPEVMAMAGCHTDNVPGIFGIGQKKACQYINGTLKQFSKAHTSIESPSGEELKLRNYDLVKLPYKGCPKFKPKKDKLNREAWFKTLKRYGMKSLIDRLPLGV